LLPWPVMRGTLPAMGHLSTVALRSALGWSQSDLAREISVSRKTIYRIDKGLTRPRANIQRDIARLAAMRVPELVSPNIKRHVIDPERMRHYLGSTATHDWSHWSKPKRGQFRRWRLYYRRILADQSAGRCIILYQYRDRARTPQRILSGIPNQ
jgi:DNA-binding XRE family transcriptional regulator